VTSNAKSFDILAISLSVLYYFDDSYIIILMIPQTTKLFSNLYLNFFRYFNKIV